MRAMREGCRRVVVLMRGEVVVLPDDLLFLHVISAWPGVSFCGDAEPEPEAAA